MVFSPLSYLFRGLVDEQLCGLNICGHIRQLKTYRLELMYLFAKSFSLMRVFQGRFIGTLSRSYR